MNFSHREYKEKISTVFENSYYIRDLMKESIKVDYYLGDDLMKSFEITSTYKTLIIEECKIEDLILFYYDDMVDIYIIELLSNSLIS